jgi:hemerythrin-like domain-containing protein
MNTRRKFLTSASFVAAPIIAPVALAIASPAQLRQEVRPLESSLAELLMREHGFLSRVLIIYDAGVRRLKAKEETPPEVFGRAAGLARKLIEDHHIKIEEEMLFHQFIRRKLLNDTITVLTKQHEAGRKLTDSILKLSSPEQFGKSGAQDELIAAVEAYGRMYRAHIAREDTVFYPMLSKVYDTTELKNFIEQIKAKELKLLGEDGFQKLVEEVAAIEQQLKIDDLDSFTVRQVK